ncbi:MAG: hypothetical protein HC914_16790 [Chloroflexaceae bacterium]|nr:hypothetical protein [Chloroflexaceae bacterium]
MKREPGGAARGATPRSLVSGAASGSGATFWKGTISNGMICTISSRSRRRATIDQKPGCASTGAVHCQSARPSRVERVR